MGGERGTTVRPHVFVAHLFINDVAERKLAERGISTDEAREVFGNAWSSVANPRARVPGSRLVRGRTNGGRRLVLVLNPHAHHPDEWSLMTGWPA
jgi:chemotaxis signal transduction protein